MAIVSGAAAVGAALGGAAAAAAPAIGAIGGALSTPVAGSIIGAGTVGAKALEGVSQYVGAEKEAQLRRKQTRAQQQQLEEQRAFQAEQAQLERESRAREAQLGRESRAQELGLGREFELGREERMRSEEAARRGRATELLRTGEAGLMREAGAPLPELTAYQRALREGTTEDIQRAMGEMRVGLTQRGVRGPQAGTIMARQVGRMRREKERDVSRLAYEDAIRRRGMRTQLQQQKALAGVRGGV